jgi:hypothetical protein
MTSEPDSTARRPPTIDLTATEVDAEKTATAAEGAAATTPPEGPSSGRLKHQGVGAFLGAIVGAVLVAAIFAGLWFGGYVPPRETALPASAPATSASSGDLAARLDKIESAMNAQQPDTALAARVTAAETAEKSQNATLAALTGRISDATTAAQNAQAQAKTAADAASAAQTAAKRAAQGAVSHSDLDALSGRVAALESAVKSLSDAVHEAASADDRVARLLVAAEALRATVERGTPYPAELAAVKSLGVDQNATAPLEPFADAGVPSAASLGHDLTVLLPALQQAAVPATSTQSFLDRLEANAHQLVRITPVEVPQGDDPATLVERIGVEATHADIAAALADIAKLPPAAQSAAATWVQKAKAREAAIAAAGQISATALAALGTPKPQ